jgi:hypothetical protein
MQAAYVARWYDCRTGRTDLRGSSWRGVGWITNTVRVRCRTLESVCPHGIDYGPSKPTVGVTKSVFRRSQTHIPMQIKEHDKTQIGAVCVSFVPAAL